MQIDRTDCQNLDRALSLEWLETNGRGGFSSGTVAGANTRRYHALLLTARKPPTERFVLVNQLEEWLDLDGVLFPLSTNCYPGAVYPNGYQSCTGFSTDPWPTWTFEHRGAIVQRELFNVHGRDLVIIRWTFRGKKKQHATLHIRPKLSGRDYHATHRENMSLSTEASIGEGIVTWQMYSNIPLVRAFHSGRYRHEPEWYRHIQLPVEQQRGLDHQEDWWSPGTFIVELISGATQTLAFTSEAVDKLDIAILTRHERVRREQQTQSAPAEDPLAGSLWRAAEAYFSERGGQQTVIAGYPWFTDWGRDAFISLPGLCLVTGRFDLAWQVLAAFSAHISEGMLPNRFPDAGEQPEYNSIDSALWFIHAVDRYLAASQDETQVRRTTWPVVKQILEWYRRGTRYGIKMDDDGLVMGGVRGAPLTWMDVKIGDHVVTPRHGKPIEIQALWIKALAVGEALGRQFDDAAFADRCRADRERAVASFRKRFWYEGGGYLYDVIDGPEGNDASLRPNQLYALSLVDGLVPLDRTRQILRLVEVQLLTPVGLRTLSPNDSRYCPRYAGRVRERDEAYHQGTVWPFLLGPFVTAWIKAFGTSGTTKTEARGFLTGLEAHLREACLGQVSEIFDAEAPHEPRGCFAQAWSVAEPLRALVEDLGVAVEARPPLKRVVVRQRKMPAAAKPTAKGMKLPSKKEGPKARPAQD
ncbi:MAG TPA: amylo-alpha-1,6-glucosidase, partial [Nitrospira sp.]|nr:amylo-alpha-1,6-glucosidase [Nitrospira sp.]